VENQPIDSAVPESVQIDVTAAPKAVAIDVPVEAPSTASVPADTTQPDWIANALPPDPAPVVEVVTPEADMSVPPHPSEVFQLVGDVAPAAVDNGAQPQTGEFSPIHPLLDSIETMVAFASSEVNHTVRDLVKKIRDML